MKKILIFLVILATLALMTMEGVAQEYPLSLTQSGSGSLTRDSDNLKGDGGDLKPSPTPSPSGSLTREGNTVSSPAPGETDPIPLPTKGPRDYNNRPKGPSAPRVATSEKSPKDVSPAGQTSKKTTQTSQEVKVVSQVDTYNKTWELNPDSKGPNQVVRINYPDGSHETYVAPIAATPAPQTASGDETKKADGQSAKESEESNVGLVLLAFIGLCSIGGGITYLASNR